MMSQFSGTGDCSCACLMLWFLGGIFSENWWKSYLFREEESRKMQLDHQINDRIVRICNLWELGFRWREEMVVGFCQRRVELNRGEEREKNGCLLGWFGGRSRVEFGEEKIKDDFGGGRVGEEERKGRRNGFKSRLSARSLSRSRDHCNGPFRCYNCWVMGQF